MVKPILDFVGLKEELLEKHGLEAHLVMKLVKNIFCKVVMVKEYATALEIAKSNDLTCVTPQLQIVYAGAFITRVGSQHGASQGGQTT